MDTSPPTHALIDREGTAVDTGTGPAMLALLGRPSTLYSDGFRVVEIAKVKTKEATVSAVAVERLARQETELAGALTSVGITAALANGFAKTKTASYVSAGQTLVALGHENLGASRQKWEQQGQVVDQLESIAQVIDREGRADVTVDLRDLRMLPDGRIFRVNRMSDRVYKIDEGDGREAEVPGGKRLALEERVLGQLTTLYQGSMPAAGQLMGELRPDRRARVFNGQVLDFAAKAESVPERVLRTRNGDGNPSVFASVSTTYGALDGNVAARTLASALRGQGLDGLRGEAFYDWKSTLIEANGSYHVDPGKVVDFGAGDLFDIGFRFRTGDAGNSGIKGWVTARRNGCLNLIVIFDEAVPVIDIRHTGDPAVLQRKVREGIDRLARAVSAAVQVLEKDWGKLRSNAAWDVVAGDEDYTNLTAREVLKLIASDKALDSLDITKQRKRELLPVWNALPNREEVLLKAFDREPGETSADLINAVTRSWEFVPVEQRHDYEVAGGMLMRALAAGVQ